MVPARPTGKPRPVPHAGARIGAWEVAAVRGDDAVAVHAGEEIVLAFGDPVDLEREAHALRSVSRQLPVPEVVGVEVDEAWGPYLVLRERVSETGPVSLDLPRVHRALRAILDVARTVERAGFAWSPRVDDVALTDEGPAIRRLRGAARLGARERLDGRAVLETIGAALTCAVPALPLELLRVVLPRHHVADRSLDAVEAELLAASVSLGERLDEEAQGAQRLASCSDVGLVRENNEDAVVTAETDRATFAIVCDGVSASRDAHLAAQIAAETARAGLVTSAEEPAAAMEYALRSAHEAICAVHARRGGEPLGTTIVAARVEGARLTIGWVGDSRAYWLGDETAALLTHDHSWLEEALAAGVTTWEDAVRSPFAHALTRCLGPLEGGDSSHAEPEVIEVAVEGHGFLVLCTDGLWNYAPSADEIAALARAGRGNATGIARALVAAALSRGGQDNVTVAVVEVGA